MTLRHATERDLPRIVEIYNASIPTRQSTADTEEITLESRREWFHKHTPDRRPLLVLEVDGEVGAWMSFEEFYGRPAYRHTAELSIYIAPELQGRGMGRQLLHEAERRASQIEVWTLVCYVFMHNEPSMRLLRSFGYQEWGRLPNVAEMDGSEYSLCIMGKRLTTA